MNLFGRHSYYQAHEIKPGDLYLASRGDESQLVLGLKPMIDGNNTEILIVKRLTGTSFTSDFLVMSGERFAYQSKFMLLLECMLVPSIDVARWKMTPHACAPIGALYSINGSMFASAKTTSNENVLVNWGTGEVVPPNRNACFWTDGWQIEQKDSGIDPVLWTVSGLVRVGSS